jgi:hypothetical protein
MISGEHLGGFYALYILLGLFAGAVHTLLAVAGIIILLISYHRFNDKTAVNQLLNIIGVLLLFASIYFFFWNDKQHYNWGSFSQTVPVITMVLTTLIATCFLISNFLKAKLKALMIV